MSTQKEGLTMRFVQKTFAVVAVFGFLAFAPKVSAGFTPPSNLLPFLPAANQVTVVKVAQIGATAIYSCSMGGGVAVPAATPVAQVRVIASENCSWQAFRLATATSDSASQIAAQNWWQQNICNPYYTPLLAAAKTSALVTRPVLRR
jgi:hypothetical protein